MTKYIPSPRARAFIAWMKSRDLKTARVSAKAGMTNSTLASFVAGKTHSLKGETEQKLAEAWEVTVDEMFGGGSGQLVPIIGRVGADAEGAVIHTTGQASGDRAPIPPGGTAAAVALEVTGHSMRGQADHGSLIYFEDQRTAPTPDMVGCLTVVETDDGRVLLKRLLRGERPGTYDLESANGPTLKNARLVWAAHVTAIVLPHQARRIIVRQEDAA